MTFVLFEIYYRIFYVILAISIVECFSYFIQGHQLEFFSGLLTFSYQAVDFDFYEDFKRYGFCTSLSHLSPCPQGLERFEQEDYFLLFENKEQCIINEENEKILLNQQSSSCWKSNDLDKQCNNLLALSPNEGRAWFYLFIVYLSYFYCLEVDKTTLSNMLVYTKLVYFCILTIFQVYSTFTPGLLKKWTANSFFILIAVTCILVFSQSGALILIASLEELQLEQLDSELL